MNKSTRNITAERIEPVIQKILDSKALSIEELTRQEEVLQSLGGLAEKRPSFRPGETRIPQFQDVRQCHHRSPPLHSARTQRNTGMLNTLQGHI